MPALPGGGPGGNLNRTGVLLPKIGPNGLAGASYHFEAGASDTKTQSQGFDNSKFKLKSTGGAGFNSNAMDSQLGNSIGNYEPSSASRRTPRRTIGAKLNNSNNGIASIGSSLVPKPSQGASISAIGGMGGAQNIQWPS